MRTSRMGVLALFLAATVLLAACQASVAEPATPTVKIASPADGASLPAGPLTVTVAVAGFDIVNRLGQPAAGGEGHVLYYMDVQPPTTAGQPATTPAGTSTAAAAMSYTWQNVSPGTHTFAVQLVNNDDTPLDPPVTASATVTVEAAASPAPEKVTIDLTAQNIAFNLKTITVPPGADVVVNFDNKDNVAHNLSVYETSQAKTPIFIGDKIMGPATTTYEFTAPTTPGTYFFRCDVHPQVMTGDFIVAVPS